MSRLEQQPLTSLFFWSGRDTSLRPGSTGTPPGPSDGGLKIEPDGGMLRLDRGMGGETAGRRAALSVSEEPCSARTPLQMFRVEVGVLRRSPLS
eukprot:1215761-Rhodomonas_salina.1